MFKYLLGIPACFGKLFNAPVAREKGVYRKYIAKSCVCTPSNLSKLLFAYNKAPHVPVLTFHRFSFRLVG